MLYYEIPQKMQIICNIGIMLWAVANVYLVFQLFSYKLPIWQRCLITLYGVVSVLLFQGVSDAAKEIAIRQNYSLLARTIQSLPIIPLFAVMILFLASEILCVLHLRKRLKKNLSPNCVKESMDALPDGIAFAKESGMPILVNAKMQHISSQLTGGKIMNLNHFWKALQEHPNRIIESDTDSNTFIIADLDGVIWNLQKSQCELEGISAIEVTACDITSMRHLREQLKQRNDKLIAVNTRLKRFSKDMEQVTREQELLDAKVKMHDNLGKMLLAYRSYEQESENEQNRRKLLDLWQQTISVLEQEGSFQNETNWTALLRMAQQLKVEIQLTGEIPQADLVYPLFMVAVRECLTNTVKHAKGNMMYVCVKKHETMKQFLQNKQLGVRYTMITIRNNGILPQKEVIEGGGLRNLRTQIEDAGGIMVIDCVPNFLVTIWLPEYKEGNECED